MSVCHNPHASLNIYALLIRDEFCAFSETPPLLFRAEANFMLYSYHKLSLRGFNIYISYFDIIIRCEAMKSKSASEKSNALHQDEV